MPPALRKRPELPASAAATLTHPLKAVVPR